MEFRENDPYIVTQLDGGRAVVHIAPICDHARTQQHEAALALLVERNEAVACDLSQTTLIASDWLRWLARLQAKAKAAGKIFGLAGMNENVLATADVLGLGEKLNKVASVEEVWSL
ncbi:MAG: STAS domain-containing protein [Thermoanaerobaculia bacterium]